MINVVGNCGQDMDSAMLVTMTAATASSRGCRVYPERKQKSLCGVHSPPASAPPTIQPCSRLHKHLLRVPANMTHLQLYLLLLEPAEQPTDTR
jgi:hypothetical protein